MFWFYGKICSGKILNFRDFSLFRVKMQRHYGHIKKSWILKFMCLDPINELLKSCRQRLNMDFALEKTREKDRCPGKCWIILPDRENLCQNSNKLTLPLTSITQFDVFNSPKGWNVSICSKNYGRLWLSSGSHFVASISQCRYMVWKANQLYSIFGTDEYGWVHFRSRWPAC